MRRRTLIIGGAAAALAGGATAASFAAMGSPDSYARAIAAQRAPLSSGAGAREAIRFATLAASGHNTQPWRFLSAPNVVRIEPDLSRRTPIVDPDDHHMYVSLGGAIENLVLAAAALGMPGEVRFEPQGDGAVVFDFVFGAARPSELCDAIPRRQSTRVEYDRRAISPDNLARLTTAAATPGVDVVFITERNQIDRVRDLVIAGNSVQMADEAFIRELKAWMRFNPQAALWHGDGLYSAASGNPTLPGWIGAPMFDLVFKADAENEKYARHLSSSSGVAVFSGGAADHAHWVQVGRSCQRFALQATALGIKVAFINQPVEVTSLRGDLAALAGMSGRRPDIVMRFGYGPDVAMSPRRPVDAVIDA